MCLDESPARVARSRCPIPRASMVSCNVRPGGTAYSGSKTYRLAVDFLVMSSSVVVNDFDHSDSRDLRPIKTAIRLTRHRIMVRLEDESFGVHHIDSKLPFSIL